MSISSILMPVMLCALMLPGILVLLAFSLRLILALVRELRRQFRRPSTRLDRLDRLDPSPLDYHNYIKP